MSATSVGRNSTCPCDSGRKYKKCCLARANAMLPRPAGRNGEHLGFYQTPAQVAAARERTTVLPSKEPAPPGPTYWAHPPGQPDAAPPAGEEWVEYVFVKDKGWTHEGQLKPGDQYRLNGGGWETVQPERVIRTTHEHPFFVMGRGWTPAGEIRPGDVLRTEDGWVPVSESRDTGQWETVYNLRVADYHTYFVGTPEWGFAVWAHNMYTPQQLAAMRAHPDRQRVLTAILDAHDALPNPTATSREVMTRVRNGQLEVLFDDAMPPVGGLAPGENPVILGGQGILGNPHATPEQVHSLMLTTVHEGVHHLDVAAGRALPGAAATVEQRFFTELHAYTAEYQLAHGNQLSHLLGPEFRGARHLDDISAGVLTVESPLVFPLRQLPGVEQSVVQRVGAMFPAIPRKTP